MSQPVEEVGGPRRVIHFVHGFDQASAEGKEAVEKIVDKAKGFISGTDKDAK